jgi:hypothetical protein
MAAALLSRMNAMTLHYCATILTAITNNAASTYLGSFVDGLSLQAERRFGWGSHSQCTVIADARAPTSSFSC